MSLMSRLWEMAITNQNLNNCECINEGVAPFSDNLGMRWKSLPVSGSTWSSNISTNHVHKCKCRSVNPQRAGCINTGVAYWNQKQKIHFVWPEFCVYPSIIHDLDISFFVNKMFHYVLVTTFGCHVYGSTLIEGNEHAVHRTESPMRLHHYSFQFSLIHIPHLHLWCSYQLYYEWELSLRPNGIV